MPYAWNTVFFLNNPNYSRAQTMNYVCCVAMKASEKKNCSTSQRNALLINLTRSEHQSTPCWDALRADGTFLNLFHMCVNTVLKFQIMRNYNARSTQSERTRMHFIWLPFLVAFALHTIAWKMYVCVIDEKSNVKFGRNLIHQSRVA